MRPILASNYPWIGAKFKPKTEKNVQMCLKWSIGGLHPTWKFGNCNNLRGLHRWSWTLAESNLFNYGFAPPPVHRSWKRGWAISGFRAILPGGDISPPGLWNLRLVTETIVCWSVMAIVFFYSPNLLLGVVIFPLFSGEKGGGLPPT